jgi:integrase
MLGSNQMLSLGRAAEVFCAAKDAEGLSPRTIAWYAMILERLTDRFGTERAVDELSPPELRAWLVELRTTLAPVSIAGYVRGLRAVGNWLVIDGLADARALRTLARPRVPHKVMEPLSDADLRRLLAVADVRDRAILLLRLDTGLRVSEAAGISVGDLRRRLDQGHGQGRKGADRTGRDLHATGDRALHRAAQAWISRRAAIRQPVRRATGPDRDPAAPHEAPGARRRRRPLQPAHLSPHIRPQLPGMPRLGREITRVAPRSGR